MSISQFIPPLNVINNEQPFRSDVLNIVITSDIMRRGICSDQIKSSDDYYEKGLKQIITSNVVKGVISNELEANTNINTISWNLTYTDVTPNRPKVAQAADIINVVPLMPNEASLRNLTYSAELHVRIIGAITAHYADGDTRSVDVNVRRHIGSIPVVVGGKYCNTYGMSAESLLRIGEDPSSYGGEVIVKGISKNIDNTESSAYNLAKIYKNKGFKNEVVRFEIISKPGDGHENSAQMFCKFLTSGQIIITVDRDPLSNTQIPFYLVFRLFGWETDAYLFDNLMLDEDPLVNQYILKSINCAYMHKYKNYPNAVSMYDPVEIIKMLAGSMKSFERKYNPKDDNSIKNCVNIFMNSMDKYLLPHIGVSPEFRDEKLRNICHHIHHMFLVDLGITKETDRDAAKNKRIHAIGTALSKTTKTRWNLTVNKPISTAVENDLKKTPFDKINPNRIIANLPLKELEKGLTQPIIQGNKAELIVGKTVITNRMSSSQLHRKSRIGIYSTKQQIYNPGDKTQKQSSRAFAMRAVHPTNDGILCPSQTQEGESAGLNKQIAIGAHISMATSSALLKTKIAECDEITRFGKITSQDIRNGYSAVNVNGHIVGYTMRPQYVIDKYQHERRTGNIDQHTSMYMDPITHHIYFWCDLGRLMQMLIVVKNNRGNTHSKPSEKIRKSKFAQWINITEEHIARMRRAEPGVIDEMLKHGIVEFIGPGEHEMLYVASSFDDLWQDRHNELKPYTHCRIPAAMFGLPLLLAAFPTCNQPVRIAYHTNHARHAMGIPDLNWPFRFDTEYFYQPCNEYPLTRTIAYDIIEPGGMNINVMIGAFSGKNQEDSLVINKGSIERGRFPGIFFTNMVAEFEFSDKVGKPDPTTTDVSPHINYETISDNGIPRIGTMIKKGDAVIGRYVEKVSTSQDDRKYADRSVVYSKNEEAYVVSVFPPNLKYPARNQDGRRIIRVKLAIIRPIKIGDKLSTRSGQKGIASSILRDSDMPYTAAGVKPDIIVNTHCMPTRMTIAQMLESCVAKICAILGITVDCTAFKSVEIQDIGDALEHLGFNRDGTEVFYNPYNGRKMKNAMFVGPVFYERIEKFWSDNLRIVSGGSIDLVSRHISDNGEHRGLRLGEMEKDCIMALGMSSVWGEKAYDHSHGFTTYYCRRCQEPAVANHGNINTEAYYKCKTCGDSTEIVELPSSWSSKLVRQSMNVCNTGIKYKIAPFEYDRHLEPSQLFIDDDDVDIGTDNDSSGDNSSDAEIEADEGDEEYVTISDVDVDEDDKKETSHADNAIAITIE